MKSESDGIKRQVCRHRFNGNYFLSWNARQTYYPVKEKWSGNMLACTNNN